MDGPPDDFGRLTFTTARIPTRHRLEAWRDIVSRKLIGVEIQAIGKTPFAADARLRIFDEMRFGTGRFGASINRRSRHLIASDNDDLMLVINRDDRFIVEQHGHELTLGAGDACLLDCSEPSTFMRAAAGRITCVRLRRAKLRLAATHIENVSGRLVFRGVPEIPLLLDYLEAVDKHDFYFDKSLRQLIESHSCELIARLTGPHDATLAEARGIKGARIGAIKQDIADNLAQRDLSLVTLAARYNLSPRSLQRLFELEATTFREYLLATRLEKAHRLLRDGKHAARSISELALDCGFGDMSHFNHAFRRRFNASPTQVRRAAQMR